MNYKDLYTVNAAMNMTPMKSKKGNTKEIAAVDEKIKAFKQLYPEGGIITKILSLSDGVCVAHAEITDNTGRVIGSGTASKNQTSDNSDSYIELAETSAVGRALRFCGIGLESIINSSQVVLSADTELDTLKLIEKIIKYLYKHNYTEEQIKTICDLYKVESITDMNYECCRHYINFIKEKGGDINE